jgi:hypothetical protein
MVWKSRERGAAGSGFGSIFMKSSSIPHGFFIPGGLGHFAVWRHWMILARMVKESDLYEI